MTLEYRVLGRVEILGDREVLRLGRPLEQKILAGLLLAADRVVPLHRLVDLAWDDNPPDTAAKQIRNCVSRLRQRLAGAGAPDDAIVTEPSGYRLRLRDARLDARWFSDRLAEARKLAAAGAADEAVAAFRAALSIWRGPALAGMDGRLIRAAAGELEEQRRTALEECLAQELASGRGPELVAELSRLVAEDPLRERLRGQLMLALHRAGRRTEALEVYRQGRRLLVDELGLEPGAELRALEQAILTDSQPVAGGAETSSTARVVPAQLPADAVAFTGRRRELSYLDHRARPEVPIWVISGAAGIGKTALAVHWAHRIRSGFPDGQLYVNLHGFAPGSPVDPVEALAQFLRALGVTADRTPVDLDEAAAAYRSLLADRRILVVLDNAATAEQVRPLLPGSPGCLVVATSRDRLAGLVARDGARPLRLDVLTPDEAYTVLAALLGEDRLRAEPEAGHELAQACAYLPLALRIAAAHLTDRPHQRIGSYVSELHAYGRVAALAVDGDEQSAVPVAFDRSYAALSPHARRMFRRLGLVPGHDFTAEAVAALTDDPPAEARRGLHRLASAHLVEEPAEGRFTFHDLLREYAADRAAQEDGEAGCREVTSRLLSWYVDEAEASARALYPEILRLPGRPDPTVVPESRSALAWLDAERANLVAVAAFAAEHGPLPVAWVLSDALRGYFHLRMHTVDWLTVARTGLVAAELDGDAAAQAAARLSLGDLHWRLSQYPAAIEHYGYAAELAARAGWARGRGAVLGNLGNVLQQSGRLTEAADHYRQALEIAQESDWVGGQSANLENLGEVTWELGRLAESAAYTERALAVVRASGHQFAEGVGMTTLGEVYHAQGRLDEARRTLTQALALHRAVGNRGGEAETTRLLALVERDEGRPEQAWDLARAALALARAAGDRRYEADSLNTVASVDRAVGRHPEALDGHRQALALAREIGNRYPEVEALLGLAATYHDLGRPDEAYALARQGAAIAGEVGYQGLADSARNILADAPA